MGLFWDLLQQSQLREHSDRSASLEARVYHLEQELQRTQELLMKTLQALESYTGKDVDGDGRIG